MKKRHPNAGRMVEMDATFEFLTPPISVPPRVRKSFVHRLNVITSAIGPAPRFAGDETQEEMVAAEKKYVLKKTAVLRKYASMVKNLKNVVDEYPMLKDEYKRSLDSLK